MFTLHYIIPLIIFYFYRNKIMLWGLLLANLIDLDHIYYRLIGQVGWFESACPHLGMQCSLGYYPLHTFIVFIISILITGISFFILKLDVFKISKKQKRSKFYIKLIFWISVGIIIHFCLDYLHLLMGFGI